MDTKKTTNKFSAEVRERAVRMVRDHQGDHASHGRRLVDRLEDWLHRRGLRRRLRQAERDAGMQPGARRMNGRG